MMLGDQHFGSRAEHVQRLGDVVRPHPLSPRTTALALQGEKIVQMVRGVFRHVQHAQIGGGTNAFSAGASVSGAS